MRERPCSAHAADPYEAEAIEEAGLTYRLLRCPRCDRPRGQRLIRRVDRGHLLTDAERAALGVE